MKTYIASVRDKETKKIQIIEGEYKNIASFREILYGNGYSVRFITTPEKFDEACENWYWACEKSKTIHKLIYASHKEEAKKMGMTVKEFETWLKNI